MVLVAGLLLGCSATDVDQPESSASGRAPTRSQADDPVGTPTPTSEPLGTTPPAWLFTRVLPKTNQGFGEVRPTPRSLRRRAFTLPDSLPMLPGTGFRAKVASPPPAGVVRRSSWQPGCPVGVGDLAWIRLTFWGFDDQRHTGELLVHRDVADDIVGVFRTLYRERFPMEQMVIAGDYDPDAPSTGDGNGTGAFHCRPTTGGSSYSQHAFGLAIDVNTFQNPYEKGTVVLPELASSYLARDRVRPGMIVADGPVVRAFAGIGWEWGGAWRTLKDYQHFSLNGR